MAASRGDLITRTTTAGELRAWQDPTVAALAQLDVDRDMPNGERVDALRAMIREGLHILPQP